ncbi:GyrI-like domain-containing protein [Fontibacillus sp. BL9]|uniref:GyrI-like domain-containing protein n=1 Tax=Fontibacillus sp. BL9 TaxID=3389971 RepID=UPI00397D37AA
MTTKYVRQTEIKLAGIGARTTNAAEAGPNGRLPELWERYYRENIAAAVGGADSTTLYALYTDYESDASGAYTVIIGHEPQETGEGQESGKGTEVGNGTGIGTEISYGTGIETGLQQAVIPASDYLVFQSRKGPVQTVVAEAWGQIWAYFQDSAEKRTFTGDYELYDLQDFDPGNAVVSIYIAVEF